MIQPPPLEVARSYLRRGWTPLPVPYRSKNPGFEGWQNFTVTAADLHLHFNGHRQNIGLLLGSASGDLVDVDLDCAEAVRLAPSFLPTTGATFGRQTRPRSHWLYVSPIPSKATFTDPVSGKRLVELLTNGQQVISPGSTHEDTGELVEWHEEGEPAHISETDLLQPVRRLAAASLLALHWPEEGSRQDAALALAGGLLRAGWSEDEAARFIEAVCYTAGDEETRRRVETVCHTLRKLEAGSHATGWPTLAGILDERIVRRVCEWLGVKEVSRAASETDGNDKGTPHKLSQATKLVGFAQRLELFHTAEGHCFASIPIGAHKETLNLRGGAFRDWLAREYWQREGTMPSSQALQDAIHGLSGKARFDHPQSEVHLRVAEASGAIYLDLCDDEWRAVCITGEGWTVTSDTPVKFRRTRGMLALPEPRRGGSVSALRRFVNITDESWPLIAAWLVAALRPNKPFPVLALHGEQGSAKSTAARVLRSLIDPNKAPLRSEPRDERDLMIAANNGWLIPLDNLSRVQPWLSDALCRLASGGGFSTRELYSDRDEVLFAATRPILINGIEELATRSDLLDRTLLVNLPAIPEHKRMSEAELWHWFEIARPAVFGALLDAVSAALRNVDGVHLERLPRMADFALWGVAAEASLGLEPGAFLATYQGNRESANDLALEASPVGSVILSFMEGRDRWSGTASELLRELNAIVTEETRRESGWPKKANILSGLLKRIAPNLRVNGLNFSRGEGRDRRKILLEKLCN